jgi:hypothetical protein
MASLSQHLKNLAHADGLVGADFLHIVIDPHLTLNGEGTVEHTVQDLLLECAHLLEGRRYRFRHIHGTQKKVRETVATYAGQSDYDRGMHLNLLISGRVKVPHDEHYAFGTSELPKTWVISIEEVDPLKVPIRPNRVTDELRVEIW